MAIDVKNTIAQWRQEIVMTLKESTKSARILCVLLVFFYALSGYILGGLAITPGYLFPPKFWVWTLITSPMIENTFLMGPALIFSCCKRDVRLLSAIVYLVCYAVVFNDDLLFATSIHGLASFKAGVFVALKQSRGEDTVIFRLKVKQIPFTYLCCAAVLCMTEIISFSYFVMLNTGMFSAWIYLRFFQQHSRGRGDLADHFAFATFYPKIFRGPVGFLSNIIWNILVKLRICQRATYKYDVAAASNITISLPGTSEADAERRRKKALAALQERMATIESPEEGWSDEEETPKAPEKAEASVKIENEVADPVA
ncbi:Oidioi.mRNA.OKI2018_I69.chr2.g7452.t1.cds [Oikopleura dioica]|uniref:Oidioi.mRNA.OKI2018_I69.chr2.g7452.t1.cds n=1 Tax=Oikopleura dioica TaxID=34765 RepID=A0ABN7T9X0_OIKDI|nr:Oidioi.mRNA.OKI2018_I69.chr2.g7452.t1.cds [Oikopleura dioica]